MSTLSQTGMFIVWTEWLEVLSGSHIFVFPRPISNHWLMVLHSFEESWGLLFRFELCWVKEKGVRDLVAGWWPEHNPFGQKGFILSQKLKFLKDKLRVGAILALVLFPNPLLPCAMVSIKLTLVNKVAPLLRGGCFSPS